MLKSVLIQRTKGHHLDPQISANTGSQSVVVAPLPNTTIIVPPYSCGASSASISVTGGGGLPFTGTSSRGSDVLAGAAGVGRLEVEVHVTGSIPPTPASLAPSAEDSNMDITRHARVSQTSQSSTASAPCVTVNNNASASSSGRSIAKADSCSSPPQRCVCVCVCVRACEC